MLLAWLLLAAEPVFEAQVGVGGWTGEMSQVLSVGPTWQIRAGLEFSKWLEVDLNYTGGYNRGRGNVAMFSNGGFVDVRALAPLGTVEPFLYVGVGASYNLGIGLPSSASPIVPLGTGVEIVCNERIRAGGEGTFQINAGSDSHNWNAVFSVSYQL